MATTICNAKYRTIGLLQHVKLIINEAVINTGAKQSINGMALNGCCWRGIHSRLQTTHSHLSTKYSARYKRDGICLVAESLDAGRPLALPASGRRRPPQPSRLDYDWSGRLRLSGDRRLPSVNGPSSKSMLARMSNGTVADNETADECTATYFSSFCQQSLRVSVPQNSRQQRQYYFLTISVPIQTALL